MKQKNHHHFLQMLLLSPLFLYFSLGLTWGLIHLVHLIHVVEGHGIFLTPKSRAQISQENGFMQDATTIISEPMPDVVQGREYPGGRPFAEPGISVSNVGPCGMESYDSLQTNWNKPEHGWGIDPVAIYNSGDIVDVEWCVSDAADHGGVYSYRLCQNDALVAKFLDPQHTPTESEMNLLEECFQDGVLKCSDVPGQECTIHPDCKVSNTLTIISYASINSIYLNLFLYLHINIFKYLHLFISL